MKKFLRKQFEEICISIKEGDLIITDDEDLKVTYFIDGSDYKIDVKFKNSAEYEKFAKQVKGKMLQYHHEGYPVNQHNEY